MPTPSGYYYPIISEHKALAVERELLSVAGQRAHKDIEREQLLTSICHGAGWLIQIEEIISESIEHIEKHLHQYKLIMNIQQPAVLVPMDGKLNGQVIINLIDNAIKYTPEGTTIQINSWCDEYNATFEMRDHVPG